MKDHAARAATPIYDTTLDRAGFALALGGALAGVVAMLLVLAGGQRDAGALALAWVIGGFFAMLGMTATAGPLWLMLHIAGWRRPGHAAALGTLLALILFAGAQTWGFGLFSPPVSDARTWAFRLASALGTAALLALVAAGIALAMWRVAYRRVM